MGAHSAQRAFLVLLYLTFHVAGTSRLRGSSHLVERSGQQQRLGEGGALVAAAAVEMNARRAWHRVRTLSAGQEPAAAPFACISSCDSGQLLYGPCDEPAVSIADATFLLCVDACPLTSWARGDRCAPCDLQCDDANSCGAAWSAGCQGEDLGPAGDDDEATAQTDADEQWIDAKLGDGSAGGGDDSASDGSGVQVVVETPVTATDADPPAVAATEESLATTTSSSTTSSTAAAATTTAAPAETTAETTAAAAAAAAPAEPATTTTSPPVVITATIATDAPTITTAPPVAITATPGDQTELSATQQAAAAAGSAAAAPAAATGCDKANAACAAKVNALDSYCVDHDWDWHCQDQCSHDDDTKAACSDAGAPAAAAAAATDAAPAATTTTTAAPAGAAEAPAAPGPDGNTATIVTEAPVVPPIEASAATEDAGLSATQQAAAAAGAAAGAKGCDKANAACAAKVNALDSYCVDHDWDWHCQDQCSHDDDTKAACSDAGAPAAAAAAATDAAPAATTTTTAAPAGAAEVPAAPDAPAASVGGCVKANIECRDIVQNLDPWCGSNDWDAHCLQMCEETEAKEKCGTPAAAAGGGAGGGTVATDGDLAGIDDDLSALDSVTATPVDPASGVAATPEQAGPPAPQAPAAATPAGAAAPGGADPCATDGPGLCSKMGCQVIGAISESDSSVDVDKVCLALSTDVSDAECHDVVPRFVSEAIGAGATPDAYGGITPAYKEALRAGIKKSCSAALKEPDAAEQPVTQSTPADPADEAAALDAVGDVAANQIEGVGSAAATPVASTPDTTPAADTPPPPPAADDSGGVKEDAPAPPPSESVCDSQVAQGGDLCSSLSCTMMAMVTDEGKVDTTMACPALATYIKSDMCEQIMTLFMQKMDSSGIKLSGYGSHAEYAEAVRGKVKSLCDGYLGGTAGGGAAAPSSQDVGPPAPAVPAGPADEYAPVPVVPTDTSYTVDPGLVDNDSVASNGGEDISSAMNDNFFADDDQDYDDTY